MMPRRAGINRVVTRDRYQSAALRHHDVPGAFPHNREPRFLERPDRAKVRHPGKLRHWLDPGFPLPHVGDSGTDSATAARYATCMDFYADEPAPTRAAAAWW